ncbi:MAG: ATP-dependent DNA helicase RecG, partial [Eubacterium sp.]
QSYCILVSDNKSESTKERLQVMKNNTDGFKIADYDLKVRGPGDFFGKRQHGLPNLGIADLLENTETLEQCRECARDIIKNDRNLDSLPALCNQINNMFRKTEY